MTDRVHDDIDGCDRAELSPESLTSPALFALDYLPVPPALSAAVTTFYFFRCDEPVIRDVQPAAVGHLLVFLRGAGAMHFLGGRVDPSCPVSLLTPCGAAAQIEVAGPFHCVGAALSPLGWAALTGLHAGEWCDRLIPARDHLAGADALGAELIDAYAAGVTGEDLCGRLAEFLAPRMRKVNSRHAGLIAAVADWLGTGFDPPLDALFARSAYSPRQTQRLVERYFGLAPRELKRKYRALRIVAMLSQPDVSDAQVAQLTDNFYDQSHMIREIRHFAGRTPKRLFGGGDTILSALLDIKNFREITPQVASIPHQRDENDSQ